VHALNGGALVCGMHFLNSGHMLCVFLAEPRDRFEHISLDFGDRLSERQRPAAIDRRNFAAVVADEMSFRPHESREAIRHLLAAWAAEHDPRLRFRSYH
jgi:hypothetical protein